MIRSLLFISFILFFASCSSSRIDRKIEDSSWDSLADESYLRWGEGRLEKSAKSELPVVGCYLGETKKTLESYKKDYLAKKDDPYYWLHIGNCYFLQEKWSKAEFFYRLTLDENKSKMIKSIALNNLGLIHFKFEQWEKGKEYLHQSMGLAPKFKVPRYNMSQLYLQFGFYDKAIEVLSDSSFKAYKDIDVYFSLANAYLYKGDLQKSEEYFKLIPKDHLRREDISATYALFLIKRGKFKDAKNIMDDRERSGVVEITRISQKIEKMISSRLKEE
jgi:tetratricopeptide (TPR) repeat protein